MHTFTKLFHWSTSVRDVICLALSAVLGCISIPESSLRVKSGCRRSLREEERSEEAVFR